MESLALSQAVLMSETDAIVATDREGRIQFWNPGAQRIFGYAGAEALGQSLDLIIPPGLRARHWEGYHRVMASGTTHYGSGDVLSVPGITKAGQRVSLEFSIVMLRDAAGQLAGMASIMRDVTTRFEEMKRLRQQQAP